MIYGNWKVHGIVPTHWFYKDLWITYVLVSVPSISTVFYTRTWLVDFGKRSPMDLSVKGLFSLGGGFKRIEKSCDLRFGKCWCWWWWIAWDPNPDQHPRKVACEPRFLAILVSMSHPGWLIRIIVLVKIHSLYNMGSLSSPINQPYNNNHRGPLFILWYVHISSGFYQNFPLFASAFFMAFPGKTACWKARHLMFSTPRVSRHFRTCQEKIRIFVPFFGPLSRGMSFDF